MRIETAKLPQSALIDTGVFLRFLGERPDDPKAPICKALCKTMLAQGKELYIAAPTITETTRHKGARVPRVSGITVIAFDHLAAERLGLDGPESLITELAQATGTAKHYIKYDYMIAACAARAKASALIAWDSDYRRICESLRLPYLHPLDGIDADSRASFLRMEAARATAARSAAAQP